MIDQKLKEDMYTRIDEGAFSVKDLPDYMNLFCQLCNETEDIQEEMSGWNRIMQLDLEGAESFWLKFNDGCVEVGSGKLEGADTILKLAGDTAAAVFTGEKDATAAYTAGQLSVEGDLPDAIKLRTIIEIVREEIEE